MYVNLRRLSTAVCSQILATPAPGRSITRNFPDNVAARLLGIGQQAARKIYCRLRSNAWIPTALPLVVRPVPKKRPMVEATQQRSADALRVRVREALHLAYHGGHDAAYIRAIKRLQLAGVDTGTKYSHHSLVEQVEFLGVVAAQAMQARSLQCVLPALGIVSDITLVWDGVSIGQTSFSRHEQLCLIGSSYVSIEEHQVLNTIGSARARKRQGRQAFPRSTLGSIRVPAVNSPD